MIGPHRARLCPLIPIGIVELIALDAGCPGHRAKGGEDRALRIRQIVGWGRTAPIPLANQATTKHIVVGIGDTQAGGIVGVLFRSKGKDSDRCACPGAHHRTVQDTLACCIVDILLQFGLPTGRIGRVPLHQLIKHIVGELRRDGAQVARDEIAPGIVAAAIACGRAPFRGAGGAERIGPGQFMRMGAITVEILLRDSRSRSHGPARSGQDGCRHRRCCSSGR